MQQKKFLANILFFSIKPESFCTCDLDHTHNYRPYILIANFGSQASMSVRLTVGGRFGGPATNKNRCGQLPVRIISPATASIGLSVPQQLRWLRWL
ncbi:MAG: hypothetical protein K8963_01750, partial [Proteobacteria bacterium]|nr:hypothetical protein [Pseudomonadota bacterium]